MSKPHSLRKHAVHGRDVLKKRGSCKRKRLPKYIPFRNIYEESDLSMLTFRQQLMVLKYREALSKADTHIFFVPDDSMNLVYPLRGTRRLSKMDKNKEVNSVKTIKDAQCSTAAGIHVCVAENTSSVNAEDGNSSNEIEEHRDNESHSSAPSVNTTIKRTNGILCALGADTCLARSGVQGTQCGDRLSHLEEAIFRALRYSK